MGFDYTFREIYLSTWSVLIRINGNHIRWNKQIILESVSRTDMVIVVVDMSTRNLIGIQLETKAIFISNMV